MVDAEKTQQYDVDHGTERIYLRSGEIKYVFEGSSSEICRSQTSGVLIYCALLQHSPVLKSVFDMSLSQ
jgi:hypothetical protein